MMWGFVNHWKFTIGYVMFWVGILVALKVG